jgi:hypothetical protein
MWIRRGVVGGRKVADSEHPAKSNDYMIGHERRAALACGGGYGGHPAENRKAVVISGKRLAAVATTINLPVDSFP